MSWSGKRIAVACLLTAALGLLLCPPWRGTHYIGHRLWHGSGNPDWSRLTLELCLLAVIGALAAVVAPMVERPSARALRAWFRRAGLVLGCAAVLILAATAGYDGIVRFALWRDYNRKVQEFQAKGPLLPEAFPLNLGNHLVPPPPPGFDEGVYRISNFHEAELMLRSVGCDDRGIQRAMARFLSASTPEYDTKTLTFVVGAPDGKEGNCLPKDIFDRVAAEAAAATAIDFEKYRASTPPSPSSSDESYWKTAPPKGRQPIRPKASEAEIVSPKQSPETREVVFDFRIEDGDAAKRFFAPLPDWYTEALQHHIEVARVPDWMKPGEPPASWSFTDWLDSRIPWLILGAGMLVLSVLCFVVARRIDRTTVNAKSSAGVAT